MEKAPSGIFRKKTHFAAVSNSALKDPKLSLKAKGLYSVIQSYITIPDIELKKSKLRALCQEGEKAFDTVWKELKDAGYLKIYRSPTGADDQFRYEYELLDEADLSRPGFLTLNKLGEVVTTQNPGNEQIPHTPQDGEHAKNDPPIAEQNPVTQPENTKDLAYPPNGGYANFIPDDPSDPHPPLFAPYANGTPCDSHPVPDGGNISNTKDNKTKYHKTYKSVSQSTESTMTDGQIDEIRETLKEQIDYDFFKENYPSDLAGVDALINSMTEMLITPGTKINGMVQSPKTLKVYIDKADSTVVRDFIEHMRGKPMRGVKNISAYWRSAFINYLHEQAFIMLTI